MNFTFYSVLQFFYTILVENWLILSPFLLLSSSLVWIKFRSGSSHFLWIRFLRSVTGHRQWHSSRLKAFFLDRDDLMGFRTVTGLKQVPTLQVAERLADWATLRDLDVDVVRRAANYFDVKKLTINKTPPGWAMKLFLSVACALSIEFALFSFLAGAFAPPLLRSVATDRWYTVNGEEAHPFRNTGIQKTYLTRSECSNISLTAHQNQIPSGDVRALCDILEDKYPATLTQAKVGQQVLAAVVGGVLTVWGAMSFLAFNRAVAATELVDRISDFEATFKAV